MQPAGQDSRGRAAPGTVAVPLCSRTNASPFWIMLLLVWSRLDNGMIPFWQVGLGIGAEPPKTGAGDLRRDLRLLLRVEAAVESGDGVGRHASLLFSRPRRGGHE